MKKSKLIVITMGDPAGIGPEILNLWLKVADTGQDCFVLCASTGFLASKLPAWDGKVRPGIYLSGIEQKQKIKPGKVQAEAGRLSFACLAEAVGIVEINPGAILVTMPVSKEAWHKAGIRQLGHTDYLRDRAGVDAVLMFFHGEKFSMGLCTVHVPLSLVPGLITTGLILEKLRIIAASGMASGKKPIGVLGLNPHAGENGLMGREEFLVSEAIRLAEHEGISACGPLVPDTFFKTKADCYLALYHDQGLTPFKLVHGLSGANITLGLPYLRLSVTHGTAFGITGLGQADPAGFYYVLELARKLDFNRFQRVCCKTGH
ncbi:MAG: 4-hydroxythreonine-4-phosphate dehydrogenase PdxA [Candidatus Wallbacteria bacterium]|nr:4-hydroxythreonine-4-phosphate dehydrogenase PdxA [Candidatus Wallbacteria bacterium]